MENHSLQNIYYDLQIFKAAYFGDLESLKAFIISENDLIIKILVPEDNRKLFWNKEFFEISIVEILNWQNFAFYEYFDSMEASYICTNTEKVEYKVSFDPSVHYRNVIECLDYFCGLFDITNCKIKNYSTYRPLRHPKFGDENWLNEDDIDEALENGFKQIDLDLINEAEKGNAIHVYDLMKKGANPDIDPEDLSDESCLLHVIGMDWQYHTMMTKKLIGERENFDSIEPYEVLESLYQAGLSNYILDIVYCDGEK